jgi:hypothetical protein
MRIANARFEMLQGWMSTLACYRQLRIDLSKIRVRVAYWVDSVRLRHARHLRVAALQRFLRLGLTQACCFLVPGDRLDLILW